MPDIRIFVSFDQEHDRDLCDAMVEQSRQSGSGFAVSAQSEARDMDDPWEERQRLEIRNADQIILRNQIDYTRRAAEPVPERLKRPARPTPPSEPAPVA
jgi:hypothetical protein